ncbi:MAG TPA: CopD family protein [Caulobacter sp.]|nr:CopD family protein [Caulobacter sp.]
MTFLAQHYDLLRGLHILAVIAWMAGMLYLPRLYVYHMRAERGSQMDLTFQEMEARLLRIIINPAMGAAWILGLLLIGSNTGLRGGDWSWLLQPWMLTKLAAVVFLSGWHGFLSKARRTFADGTNSRSEKFWRMTNEIPFLLAIVIVLAVTTQFLSR